MYRASCCRPISVLMMGGRLHLILPLMVPSGSCTWRGCIIGPHGWLWQCIGLSPHISPARLSAKWYSHSEKDHLLLSRCCHYGCPARPHTGFNLTICPQCKVLQIKSESVMSCHHQSSVVGSIDFTLTIISWLDRKVGFRLWELLWVVLQQKGLHPKVILEFCLHRSRSFW